MIGNEFSQKKIQNNCTYNTITHTHLHVTSQIKKVNVKATRTHNESN